MTSPVPVPVSQFPLATTPLSGAEQVPLVQNGITKRVPASAFSAFGTTLTPESFLTVPAGITNDLNIGLATRVFIDTAAGNATVTGFVPTGDPIDGQPLVVINSGASNNLELALETGSGGDFQLYGSFDITLSPHGAQLFYYSAGLAKWVMS